MIRPFVRTSRWYRRGVPHRPPRVLVVEDVEDIRDLISINLSLEGFDVSTAEDGASCLEVVDEVAPDVITLDVAMPRLDGFSTAERLRARPETAGIPLIIVSARAQGTDQRRGDRDRGRRLPHQAVRSRRAHRDGSQAGRASRGVLSRR